MSNEARARIAALEKNLKHTHDTDADEQTRTDDIEDLNHHNPHAKVDLKWKQHGDAWEEE